jgi:transposase
MLVAFGRSSVVDEVIEGTSGHTTARMTARIEVIVRVSGRRFWTVEQNLMMLCDALGPGGSLRSAMEHQ